MNYKDQTGHFINLTKTPEKVVSLVPSITEFLIDLGVNVIGRTKFCINPEGSVKGITKIGGTKNVQVEKVLELGPDLVVANREENTRDQILELWQKVPVWVSDVISVEQSLDMMLQLGEITGRISQAMEIVENVKVKLSSCEKSAKGTIIYFIWKDPWMVAGKSTYINSMLEHLGYSNLIHAERYPEISFERLKTLNPDHIFLSSEPYPFKVKHSKILREVFPKSNINLVNGEFYSWYGSRILKTNSQFTKV